jgi:hypothetical protein
MAAMSGGESAQGLARKLSHDMEPMQCLTPIDEPTGHTLRCTGRVNSLLSFAEARDASHAAREATLREALEPFAGKDCLVCGYSAKQCDRLRNWGNGECPGIAARRALATPGTPR